MIRWNNDYNHTAHPAILKALAESSAEGYDGYGQDRWCEKAGNRIRRQLGPSGSQAEIQFLSGGTQANLTVIAAALRPVESVICAESGHIHAHETGSIEAAGHKILALPSEDGKVSPQLLTQELKKFYDDPMQEHLTIPKLLYISFPSEYGTLYSLSELQELHDLCRHYGLYLFLDGARLGYGLTAPGNDVTLADIADLTDVFYIGGTKCGAMLGEAVVIMNPSLQNSFRFYMKQRGAVLAKGWLMGLQFAVLFDDGGASDGDATDGNQSDGGASDGGLEPLYFTQTRRANEYAMKIRGAFRAKEIPFHVSSPTNQQFVVLSDSQLAKLEAAGHMVEYMDRTDETHRVVRFCTSWSTKQEEVEKLLTDIGKL